MEQHQLGSRRRHFPSRTRLQPEFQ
jgi:hypothetical protein